MGPGRLVRRELARRELARRSYAEYLAYVGGRTWKRTRFSDYLARTIQEFVDTDTGSAYDILLIESPPQHGKSITVTESLPAWWLGRHPGGRVILASYNDESAERFARRNREKVRDFGLTLFGQRLGETKRRNEFEVDGLSWRGLSGAALSGRVLSGDPPPSSPALGAAGPVRGLSGSGPVSAGATPSHRQGGGPLPDCAPGSWPEQSPATRLTGTLISRGILAGITGRPADLLIIDDPVKNRQEADSPTARRRVWNEWLNSLKTRLSDGAKVVVIMTPWHEDDLAGRLQAAEPGLRLVRLPVEAEAGDPLGRAPGEPLCPELGKDAKWLEQFRESYLNDPEGGARAWTALYQCSPRAEEGNLVRREWWKTYRPEQVDSFATELISVDAAFKGGEENDFVSIQVWGKLGSCYYLRYCLDLHLDFPQTLAAIRTVKRLYPKVGPVLIEDKANGSAIISVLQKEMFCVPVNPAGGKEARVSAVSPAIEAGHVFLPEGESWVAEFVDQFTAFPAGKHDDMVDAASQALNYMIWSNGQAPAPKVEQERREDTWDEYDVYGEI